MYISIFGLFLLFSPLLYANSLGIVGRPDAHAPIGVMGDHAHKKCSQLLVPVSGKIEIICENKKIKFKKILNYRLKEGHLIKPKTWCKIKFLTNNSILMVFCDQEYQFSDYIEKYKDFLKVIKKK